MRRDSPTALLAVALAAAVLSVAFAGPAEARTSAPAHVCATVTLSDPQCGQSQPVASLQPMLTRRLWTRLRGARGTRVLRPSAVGSCRPLRAVFYTATDWMRLATKLAANSSPCAQYFFSIPSLAADHTQVRADQAWRIRALGPQFHAMAEISMGAWAKWVTSTGQSWHQAGVEARRRMAAAGYDVAAGDSWAVNEFSSAVRQGTTTARADARNFVHGLYDGDGTRPVRGAVFTIGMGQGTQDLSVYKTNLDGWLSDSAFWADMSRYVGDWSQEVFGDYRDYGVASADLATRRSALNDYLEHVIAQANAGPAAAATARSYLQGAYSPLANAAWQYDAAFGWTLVSAAQMDDFVSAQIYALRSYDATTQPNGTDHWGFAWSPKNAGGLSDADFATQSGQLIDRIASAIHDSDHSADPADPGRNACGIGQNWCATSISGAAFNAGWKGFAYWGPLGLAFTSASQSIGAGASSAPIALRLQASGAAQPAAGNLVVSLGLQLGRRHVLARRRHLDADAAGHDSRRLLHGSGVLLPGHHGGKPRDLGRRLGRDRGHAVRDRQPGCARPAERLAGHRHDRRRCDPGLHGRGQRRLRKCRRTRRRDLVRGSGGAGHARPRLRRHDDLHRRGYGGERQHHGRGGRAHGQRRRDGQARPDRPRKPHRSDRGDGRDARRDARLDGPGSAGQQRDHGLPRFPRNSRRRRDPARGRRRREDVRRYLRRERHHLLLHRRGRQLRGTVGDVG